MNLCSSKKGIMVCLLIVCTAIIFTQPAFSRNTVVGISGENFTINGQLAYSEIPGTNPEMHGMLFNVRAVNSTFDDLDNALPEGFLDDPGDRPQNNFAGYGKWDPDANTDRFIEALPSWKEKGILAVTLNFQGGCSCVRHSEQGMVLTGVYQTPNNNPFGAEGTPIHPAYLDRLKRVIDELDANGMVAILGMFYFGQDHRISPEDDSQAVKDAVDAVVDWVEGNGWRNVLIEINNEANLVNWYQHAVLRPDRLNELFLRVKARSAAIRKDGTRLFVSSSTCGRDLPPDAWMRDADFFLPHGNGLTPEHITQLVRDYRDHPLWKAHPRPICFNEDDGSIPQLNAAVEERASWGYYDDIHYQSVWPTNWTIWSDKAIGIFGRIAEIVGIDSDSTE